MRQTVEENGEKPCALPLADLPLRRFQNNFRSVNKGLGRNADMARDVGTLNKVLSNTKTRGIMGNSAGSNHWRYLLTPAQYERSLSLFPNLVSADECAIKLPGQGEGAVYQPIDSNSTGRLLSSGRSLWIRREEEIGALPQGPFVC